MCVTAGLTDITVSADVDAVDCVLGVSENVFCVIFSIFTLSKLHFLVFLLKV